MAFFTCPGWLEWGFFFEDEKQSHEYCFSVSILINSYFNEQFSGGGMCSSSHLNPFISKTKTTRSRPPNITPKQAMSRRRQRRRRRLWRGGINIHSAVSVSVINYKITINYRTKERLWEPTSEIEIEVREGGWKKLLRRWSAEGVRWKKKQQQQNSKANVNEVSKLPEFPPVSSSSLNGAEKIGLNTVIRDARNI